MGNRQKVQVTVFNGSQYEQDGWPPEDAAGFLAWFQKRISAIPAEHMAKAKVEITAQREYYDDVSTNIEITYLRDETDAEMQSRLAAEKRRKDAIEASERAMLAGLQQKYGAT